MTEPIDNSWLQWALGGISAVGSAVALHFHVRQTAHEKRFDDMRQKISDSHDNAMRDIWQADGINRAFDTFHNLMMTGRQEAAQQFFEKNEELIAKHGLVAKLSQAEAAENKQIIRIENNSNMSAEQKRVSIMQINAQRNRFAETVFGGSRAP